MRLHEVESVEQFEAYYAANNLNTLDEKINNLTKTMKILATRCEEETKEDILEGLQESVLLGVWKWG